MWISSPVAGCTLPHVQCMIRWAQRQVKLTLKCIKHAFSILTSRGRGLQIEVWLYRNLWENYAAPLLIYYLCEHCTHKFTVSIFAFQNGNLRSSVAKINNLTTAVIQNGDGKIGKLEAWKRQTSNQWVTVQWLLHIIYTVNRWAWSTIIHEAINVLCVFCIWWT